MSYISRWLLLVSVILQISNLEAILYSGHFLYTLFKHWDDMLGAIFEAKLTYSASPFLFGAVCNILPEVYRNFAF